MATASTMLLSLGTLAPDFELQDVVTENTFARSDYTDKALLVMFMCAQCPFVKHVNAELSKLAKDYAEQNIGIVAICSNAPELHPADIPENLKDQALEHDFTFPYLIDRDQSVAAAFSAACTPDFFLFDTDHKLAYRGQLDASRPRKKNIPVTGEDLRNAIDAVLTGEKVSDEQFPSIGCNIKWRAGNAPDYYTG